jgi:hypothetical protein
MGERLKHHRGGLHYLCCVPSSLSTWHGTAAASTFAAVAAAVAAVAADAAAAAAATTALDGCFGAVVLLRLVRRHVHHRWHWKL